MEIRFSLIFQTQLLMLFALFAGCGDSNSNHYEAPNANQLIEPSMGLEWHMNEAMFSNLKNHSRELSSHRTNRCSIASKEIHPHSDVTRCFYSSQDEIGRIIPSPLLYMQNFAMYFSSDGLIRVDAESPLFEYSNAERAYHSYKSAIEERYGAAVESYDFESIIDDANCSLGMGEPVSTWRDVAGNQICFYIFGGLFTESSIFLSYLKHDWFALKEEADRAIEEELERRINLDREIL